MQHIRPAHQAAARAAHEAAIARDEAAFRAAIRRMIGLDGGTFETYALGYTRKLFEPLFSSPFRITRSYVARIVDDVQSIKKEMIRGRNTGFVKLPPGMLFMNRLQFGFYSVLARLDVEVDYAAEERAFLVDR